MMGTDDDMVVFHGTDTVSATDILENGIRESALQRRDRGFFGDGFYLTEDLENAHHHAVTVSERRGEEPEVLSVAVDSDCAVLDMQEYVDSVNPTKIPPWHSDFIQWVEDTLVEAAVWEKIPSVERFDVLSRGINERTPDHEQFDGDKWRRDVTRFARDNGCDVVRWNPTEIIVVNPDTTSLSFSLKTDL